MLPSVEHHCSEATVNRKLSALSAFYQHAARHGIDLGELLRTWQPAGGRSSGWKPFLHHISKRKPQARRAIVLSAQRKLPRVLTATEAQTILDACDHLRDRFLFAVLFDTGMRIGEALGLRHEDIAYGHPLTYTAVYDLVKRLRRRTGIDFDPHWYRHTAATRMLRDGVPIEVVSKLLGHADITTTAAVYGHLSAEDARQALEEAGWFTGREVRP